MKKNEKCILCKELGHDIEECLKRRIEREPSVNAIEINEDTIGVKPGWRIMVEVGDISIPAIVDTGATLNCMNLETLRNIKGNVKPRMKKEAPARTVNGGEIEILGRIDLPVEIKGQRYVIRNIAIGDMGPKMVMGQPFLTENNVVIRSGEGTMSIGEKTYSFEQTAEEGKRIHPLNPLCPQYSL